MSTFDKPPFDLSEETQATRDAIQKALRDVGLSDNLTLEGLLPAEMVRAIGIIQIQLDKAHAEPEYERGPEDTARRPYSGQTRTLRYTPDDGRDKLEESNDSP